MAIGTPSQSGSATVTEDPVPASGATTALRTQIVDGSGNQITSFGGGTQYAEGATVVSATGTIAMGKSGTTVKALQTDTSGNLRVDISQTAVNATAIKVDGSAVIQPVSGTLTGITNQIDTNLKQVGGANVATASSGIIKVGLTDYTGTAFSSTNPLATQIPLSSASGTINGSSQSIDLNFSSFGHNQGNVLLLITGVWSGTLVFEISLDNTTYVSTNGVDPTTGVILSSTTANGQWLINASAAYHFRVRSSAWSSGTATINFQSGLAPATMSLANPIPTGSNVMGAVTQSGTWNITNVSGTVSLPTGASTAAKQPALGVAGTASTDVISVQGIAGMTKLLVTPDSVALPANQSVNVSQINGVTPLMGNGTTGTGSPRVTIASDNTVLPAVGAGATGATVPANASYGGLLAQTANPAAATAGNLVGALADKLGKQVVVGSIRDLKVNQITTITSSTSETTVLSAVASTFLDVYGVIVVNSSATAANVSFKDATAGTTRFNIYVPAGDTRGFMLPESGAITQAVVNNNWTATSSASVASLIITMLAVKNI